MKLNPLHYTEDSIKQMLNQSNYHNQIIALAYASGARVSELNQIKKEDVKEVDGYLEISCVVLKKRTEKEKHQGRVALVRLDEDWLVEPIRALVAYRQPGEKLIPETRVTIYRWLKAETGLNPHMFRAIRATHLAQKGFTAHQLKHFFGWSTVAPSDYYVRLNTKDLRY